jgi:hypothetical protein
MAGSYAHPVLMSTAKIFSSPEMDTPDRGVTFLARQQREWFAWKPVLYTM